MSDKKPLKLHLKEGALHKQLGVSKDKKIPAEDLEVHKGDDVTTVRRKTFAKNAKGWHH